MKLRHARPHRTTYRSILPLLLSCLLPFIPVCAAQPSKDASRRIDRIDFFGYEGLDPGAVRQHLPLTVGQLIQPEQFQQQRPRLAEAIQKITGRPPTDIAVVCCTATHGINLYLGLGGLSSRPLPLRTIPHNSLRLTQPALALYRQISDAIEAAVMRGVSGEDQSRGYSLFVDPAVRKLQLQGHAYALAHTPQLAAVLRSSSDAPSRRAAAYLIGYAKPSPLQQKALTRALTDPDEEVRNNAIRALAVLSSPKDAAPLHLDLQPILALLFSPRWTDRNKVSFLLANLTRSRDPKTLEALRASALPPLMEGARWDKGHAYPFLLILGRIGHLPDSEIGQAIGTGRTDILLQAARSSRRTP